MPDGESLATPRLRQAAIITIAGAVMAWGVPFAEFRILPDLFVAGSAAETARNLSAHHGQFLLAIFAYYLNFIGDIVVAWGLYLLLRPVNASISMFVAWVRVAFAALGLAALQNLVTANQLVTRASDLAALGQAQLDAQVFVAVVAFRSQFAFSQSCSALISCCSAGSSGARRTCRAGSERSSPWTASGGSCSSPAATWA